jgi:hypothetical protein
LKYINRERKKKDLLSEEITMEEWEEYFMKLLEGRKDEQSMEREGFSVDWREGVICPIYKGETNRAENYRGITLLNMGYQLYPSVLSERMKREIEEKGVVPDRQAGFRKGRGTIDNVYILDHLAKSELKKKEGRMCALFVDFRAAFDKVDIEKMFGCLREKEISEWLVGKGEEIYARTKSKVKVGEKGGDGQGESLEPGVCRRHGVVAKSEREMKK